MADRFVYIRKNEEPSKQVSLRRVMIAARLRMVGDMVDYHLRLNEDKTGPGLRRATMLRRLKVKLGQAGVGDKYRVYANEQPVARFVVHKVQPTFQVIDISGNHNADVYYTYIMNTWGVYKPSYAGSYVCKDIAGSSTPSQHSYGNAVDFFFDSLAHQDVVANWVVAHAEALNVLPDGHIISRDRIWDSGGWHAYDGDYHSHLHVDFSPQFAGPCGVREP